MKKAKEAAKTGNVHFCLVTGIRWAFEGFNFSSPNEPTLIHDDGILQFFCNKLTMKDESLVIYVSNEKHLNDEMQWFNEKMRWKSGYVTMSKMRNILMMRFIGNYVNISQIKVCLHYLTSWIVYVGVSQTSYCKIGRISVSLEVGKLSDQKVSCLLWCLSGHMSIVTFQIICTCR